MAKNDKAKQQEVEPITLVEIAEELNSVMQYGCDPKTGELVRPEEQIDVTQKEKALLADILKNAKADLRPDDENAFSEDAWNWFLDNGITPGADSDDNADEGEAEPAPKGKGKAADKAPAKEKAPAKGKAADEDGEKRGIKKAMVPGGNEAKAIELAKEGCNLDDFIDEFTKIYKSAGNNDKEYAAKRAKIYYKIGYDRAGLTPPDAPKGGKDKAPAKGKDKPAPKDEPAPRGRGRGRDADPEPEDQEPPRRGRR